MPTRSPFQKTGDAGERLVEHIIGVDDDKRPSLAFANFLERFRSEKRKVSLLFTSRPRPEKFRDFDDLIEPLRGGIAALDRGDVQLVHDDKGWRVTQHHIKV